MGSGRRVMHIATGDVVVEVILQSPGQCSEQTVPSWRSRDRQTELAWASATFQRQSTPEETVGLAFPR
jgi:hypothetical protein